MPGVVPALLAATGFAIFQIVNRRALSKVDVYRGTATLLAVGALVLWAVAATTEDLSLLASAPAASLALSAAAGFVHFFCGWTFLGMSQVRLGAARAGILIGTVPLFGALVAALWLDEPLGPLTLLGLAVVVAGVAVVTTRGGTQPSASSGARLGAAAGLATALCWSVSPVLIRLALEGLPSPLLAAAVGMATSAAGYAALVAVAGARDRRDTVTGRTWGLLVAAGLAVSLSIWMQWTAFDLAPIALVLGVLQLTPPLVVLLAVTVGGDALTARGRRRAWSGAALTVGGSLLLIIAT